MHGWAVCCRYHLCGTVDSATAGKQAGRSVSLSGQQISLNTYAGNTDAAPYRFAFVLCVHRISAAALLLSHHRCTLLALLALFCDLRATRLTSSETDKSGQFCFEVVPGSYKVTPSLTASEQRDNVLLSPPSRDVTVNDAPVLDAHFSQVNDKLQCSMFCGTVSAAAFRVCAWIPCLI